MSDRTKTQHSKDLHNFIDSHLRELKWTSYGLGLAAVAIIFRKLRVSKKFLALDQIPSSFISKNYTLQGHIKNVTDTGVLQIEHTPIVEVRWISRLFNRSENETDAQRLLSVLPAGLDLNPDGVQWLKTNASGQHAWFQMMARDKQMLYCDVRIKKNYFGRVSISQALLKGGVCKLHHFSTPPEGDGFNQYLIRLIALEHRAAKKGHGMWKEEGSWLRRKAANVFTWGKDKGRRLFRRNKD